MATHASGWRRWGIFVVVLVSSIVFFYYSKTTSVPGYTKPKNPMPWRLQEFSGNTEDVTRSSQRELTAANVIPKNHEGNGEHGEGKEEHQRILTNEVTSATEGDLEEHKKPEDLVIADESTVETGTEDGSQPKPIQGKKWTNLNAHNFGSTLNSFAVTDQRSFKELTDRRLAHLHKECETQKKNGEKNTKTLRKGISVYHLFSTCVAPKGGSTSWHILRAKVKELHIENNKLTSILSVRHPLSRLASAYRDKFLNGAPIWTYDEAWRNATSSIQTWRQRWSGYWLPALISRGDIKPSEHMLRRHALFRNISSVCKTTLRSNVAVAREVELDFRFKMQDFVKRYSNASFTFRDFLNHVLWTYDFGIMDHHWAPQTCLCNPCDHRYDYVLQLENIQQEVRLVFDDLGVPDGVQIGSGHNTKRVLKTSDGGYFQDIEEDLMRRILRLYKDDFQLFGYT